MSEPDPQAVLEDTLYIACTRPAMMWGVPAEGLMLNLCGSIICSAWVGMGSWHMLAYMVFLIPAIHMVMRFAAARDPNWFRTKKLGIETKGYGTAQWGGSTVTPLPCRWPLKAKDLPIAF